MNEPLFEISQEGKSANYAKFAISPLSQGYGDTLGNSLRRVLLTSLPGAAITTARISGVKHQFTSLKGMKEDVVEFLLNLKKVRFSVDSDKPVKGTIEAKGPKTLKASDIKVSGAKVVNGDLVLATLAKDAKLDAELTIETGVGYSPEEDRETRTIGTVPLDASFSPVVRVNYKVEETRVGRFTNFDKLILEIWTNGTIEPKDALIQSSQILVSYFNQVISPKKAEVDKIKELDTLGPVGKLSVEEIGLPTRIANALTKAEYETVEALVKAKKEDLVKVRNLGEKSLKIVAIALSEKGVRFEI